MVTDHSRCLECPAVHANILACHLRRHYSQIEPYKTMGYNSYLNLPPSAQSNSLKYQVIMQIFSQAGP